MWNAVHTTSQVTHNSNYMLANIRTESDRVVRKKGRSLKRVTGIPVHHLIKLRGHLKKLGGILKMQFEIILEIKG